MICKDFLVIQERKLHVGVWGTTGLRYSTALITHNASRPAIYSVDYQCFVEKSGIACENTHLSFPPAA